MFMCNVFLTFIMKRLIKGIDKTFEKTRSIINGFSFPSFFNLYQTFYYKHLQNPNMCTGNVAINVNTYGYIVI